MLLAVEMAKADVGVAVAVAVGAHHPRQGSVAGLIGCLVVREIVAAGGVCRPAMITGPSTGMLGLGQKSASSSRDKHCEDRSIRWPNDFTL